jgi:phosphoribosylanthranilate isomerase
MTTRIKFCGLTRQQDVLEAAQMGVHAIGLVFHPDSPRAVDVQQAQGLSRVCPPFITRVGLFMNQDASTIMEVLKHVELDILQFHGEEPEDYCVSFNKPYLKSIAMGGKTPDEIPEYSSAQAYLLDSNELGQPGGSGKAFDWGNIPKNINKPVIVAGGLSPDNVTQAIQCIQPYAVDVSSGIESAKGIKDSEKMKTFINSVRVADEC